MISIDANRRGVHLKSVIQQLLILNIFEEATSVSGLNTAVSCPFSGKDKHRSYFSRHRNTRRAVKQHAYCLVKIQSLTFDLEHVTKSGSVVSYASCFRPHHKFTMALY